MKRTTVKLDDEVDARVRHEAARRGVTVSQWVREAVAAHLPGQGEPGGQRFFSSQAAGRSGRTDISERIDEYLAEIYEARDSHRHAPDA